MYIIRKGHVAVVGKHNQLLSVMGPGDNFGEIALLTQVWMVDGARHFVVDLTCMTELKR